MKNNKGLIELFNSQKDFIYPILIITAGMLVGVILFNNSNDSFNKAISKLFEINQVQFLNIFINQLSLYLSVFTITVLLGLCLIGFPFISIIPLIIGFKLGIQISYFYTTYSVKGIGYSVLMIIPESAAFITILIYTIAKSNNLSKNIYSNISKKEGITQEINLSSYLKSYLLYGLIITIISLINASCSYFLSAIITI